MIPGLKITPVELEAVADCFDATRWGMFTITGCFEQHGAGQLCD